MTVHGNVPLRSYRPQTDTDMSLGVTDAHAIKYGKGPKQAANRVNAEELSDMAKKLGRCGDINPLTGYVCVTQPHSEDDDHMAIQIGGVNDGQVYSTWRAKD